MKKRWTALACTLGLCASLTLPAAAAGGYTDVPGGAWYESAVNEVTEKGYMTGVSESQFAPTANVTRATVVTVLWRMEGSPAPTATVSFGDVSPGAWYAQPVAWAKENGIANGDSRGDFKPDQSVTRQELAAFLTRFDQYRGVPLAGWGRRQAAARRRGYPRPTGRDSPAPHHPGHGLRRFCGCA